MSIERAEERESEIPVPGPEAPWSEVWRFALSWNGYIRHGAFEAVAEVAKAARDGWKESGVLSQNLPELRTALFFEQRAYRHSDQMLAGPAQGSEGPEEEYLRALLRRIADLSGGAVPGPPDQFP